MKSFVISMLIASSAGMKINQVRNVQVGDTVLWKDEFVQTGDYSHDWESDSKVLNYQQRDHAWNDAEYDVSDEVRWHNETIENNEYDNYHHTDDTVPITNGGYTLNNQGWD